METESTQIDPVCHMVVRVADDRITTDFKGSRYYFCAAACKAQFLASPQKYIGSPETKRKGFWQRYLDRLNKATGGKPPSCCK